MTLIRNVKNWLIKRLGGFTPEEFILTHPSERILPTFRSGTCVDVVAEAMSYVCDDIPQSYIKHEINRLLLKELEPYVCWQQTEVIEQRAIKVRATVKVVAANDP